MEALVPHHSTWTTSYLTTRRPPFATPDLLLTFSVASNSNRKTDRLFSNFLVVSSSRIFPAFMNFVIREV
ncbi:hypothetical protein L6452_01615 [Arctium lappa]|uniref:Uncharacterized protein n=1 Tax=Arctium lappa TaxID=4217 RepID=A0ACB9FHK6_ARCLA|nr:hypothetical protein L6452_01615 [Arctium lappa]